MNAPIKLSLAIALALAGTNVWALGLGAIQVKSGLNQPLIAEIPVTVSSPAEAADLQVAMATDEDFQRVGLSRARMGATLQFAVVTQPHGGGTVIQITSTESVREPYLDFLIQANWAKGKLLREYTVLLDPPVTAPASKPAVAAEPRPAPVAKAPAIVPGETTAPAKAHKPAAEPQSAASVASKAPASAPSAAISGKQYGPVTSGSALSQVAQAVRGDSSTDLNQLMLALYKANPQAFFKPNINALKTGAVLRIPSADEIQAAGSLREAAAQVNSQARDWASNSPTMVAGGQTDSSKTDKSPAKSDSSGKKGTSERLALVPPRAGKDDQAKADQPGAAGHGKTVASAASAAELARTQESLVAREHEAAELKSRLKDLEDIKSKNDRLISLKDSEIAELQRKLKDTQDAAAKAAAAKPVAPVVAQAKPADAKPADAKLAETKPAEVKPVDTKPADAKAADAKSTDVKPVAAITPPAPATTPGAADVDKHKADAASATTAPVIPGVSKPDITPPAAVVAPLTAATPATTPATPSAPTITPSTPATLPSSITPLPASDATATSGSSTDSVHATPPISVPATSPAPAATVPAAKPAPAVTPKPATPATDEPWYKNTLILSGAGVVLFVLGLLALLRSRKPATPIRPTRDSAEPADGEELPDAHYEEEHALLEELARHPDDIDRHLELLSLYYAHRDVAKFESAAQAMHAQVTDPSQLEWQQVKAMGAELAPTYPLFADDKYPAHYASEHIDDVLDHDHDHMHDPLPEPAHVAPTAWTANSSHDAITKPHLQHLDTAGLDLPMHHDLDLPIHHDLDATAHEAHNIADMDEPDHTRTTSLPTEPLGLEEAIVTKLDLARAYLDMGDPEGARGMVEEVLAEGNETQKVEARKLLAEIR